MKPIRVTRPLLAILLLASCSELNTELPETTTVQIVSPNAGLIRSADGQFEVEFQLGALSGSAEIYIRTDRSRTTNDWRMSEILPHYEVRISPCTIASPELVRVRHRVAEDLVWNGRLTLARTVDGLRQVPLPTSFEGGWVSARGVLECTPGANAEGVARFELATSDPPECALTPDSVCNPCEPCSSADPGCSQTEDWICASARCVPISESADLACGPERIEGWDDPPSSGRVFVVDDFAIAGQGRGFDVDGSCRGPGDCIDNSLWQMGELSIRAGRLPLLSGEFRLLIELAGLDEPFEGADRSLTFKVYRGRDADDPAFPANDFQIPVGETSCCEFSVLRSSVAGTPPQGRSRAPARIERGKLSTLASTELDLLLDLASPPPSELRLVRALFSGRLDSSLDGIEDGLIGGVVPLLILAQTDNPYCKTLNSLCPRQLPESKLIDLIASILQPDIDLDGDGLERLDVGVNGRVGRCLDGNGNAVPPISPDAPAWTCTLDPRMADGYSIAFTFTAVPATIVGIAD